MKSLLVSSGFERINDGYDYKPLYVARALISNNGLRIGRICGEVSEGSLGKSMSNYLWKKISDWRRFCQRWSLTTTNNMNSPNIKCSSILGLYYRYLPLHCLSFPLNSRLHSRIVLSLSPFRSMRVQVSWSPPFPFLSMKVQVCQSHHSRGQIWGCRYKSAGHGIPYMHLYSPK